MARVRNTPLTAGLTGRIGEAVYVQGVTGTQIRRRPVRVGPLSEGQRAAADRMERISAFWARVDLAGVEAWRDYAASLEASKPALQRRPMPSWNAFLALSTRLLMIDPAADLPLSPPPSGFAGDGLAVQVEPSPLGEGRVGVLRMTGDPTPTPPQGEGVLFRANRPNAPSIVTELMLQPLASVGRAPVPSKYRSQGFVAFAEGSLEVEVPCRAGWVACAVRFVHAETGQATAVFPLGIVRVDRA